MRLLFTSTPGTGHVLHMLPLAHAAMARGHDVHWATGADAHALLARAGIPHSSAGLDLATRNANSAAARPATPVPPRQRRVHGYTANFGATTTRAMRADLQPVVTDWRPDLIVHEPCELAAPLVARERGVASVTAGFGQLIPGPVLAPAVEQLAPLWAEAGFDVPADLGLYEHAYLHPLPASLDPLDGDTTALMRPMGYDGTSADEPLHPATAHEPEVYVTFGTEFAGVAPWRAVLDALADTGIRALVTIGGSVDAAALGAVPPLIRVERWVPQRQALRSVRLVVSHGGSGAMLGAFIEGIPHLAIPIAADQFDNGDLLATSRTGTVIDADQATAESLAAAMRCLLSDETVRQRCAAVRAEIATMPSPDDVIAAVEPLAG